VRLGVFVLSLLSLVGGSIYAAGVWYAYNKSLKDATLSLTTAQKIAFLVTGVVYSILALASFLGLIGAIGRKRGLVATYSTAMWFLLAAQTAVAAFFIYALFQNNDQLVTQCTDQVSKVNDAGKAADPNFQTIDPTQACTLFTKWGRIGAIISLVVALLVELYCCFIVSRYVSQLTDEQSFRAVSRNTNAEANAGRSSGYYPHQPLHSGTELLSKNTHEYPFAQPKHSFGHKA